MRSITIFTPTYNREKVLKRLYVSLTKQTCKDFVWLIVDDGSTDNTEYLVKKWIAESSIDIKYVKQTNRGKSMAHNRAVRLTKTDLFVCLDSNDCVAPKTVEMIIQCWDKIKADNSITGIMSPKKVQFKDIKGKINIKTLPKYIKIKYDKKPYAKSFGDRYYIEEEKTKDGLVKTTLRNAYRVLGLNGEALLVFRTSVISKYMFPNISGEKFVPEAYLYDLIDKNGTLAVLNRTLCIHRYQIDGYTFNMSKLIKDNPKGYLLYIKQRLNDDKSIRLRFLDYIRYIAAAKIISEKRVLKKAGDTKIVLAAYPFGMLLYLLRYKRA